MLMRLNMSKMRRSGRATLRRATSPQRFKLKEGSLRRSKWFMYTGLRQRQHNLDMIELQEQLRGVLDSASFDANARRLSASAATDLLLYR